MGRLPTAPDTLETLSMDRTLITLPPLSPHTPCIIPLWLCCPLAATSVKVSAVLACPHPVSASAVVRYEDPFLAWTRLSGEVGCHTLAGPSTTYAAAAAAPPVAGDGDAAAAAAGQAVLALRGLPLVIGQAVIAQVGDATTAVGVRLALRLSMLHTPGAVNFRQFLHSCCWSALLFCVGWLVLPGMLLSA
jgi:hypothetical protein